MILSCPKSMEETTEELYFGRLDSAAVQRFQAHLRDCPKCRGINDGTVAMIEAIRGAAKHFERTKVAKGKGVVRSPMVNPAR